ncbi:MULTISPECIES: hypothetical protein [unclassified Rhizobium]|uniref:hypothetical protein n=1 Tax=unclassified Rhizobium TaxID=2613769 RepID=UPI000BE81329|nr:MULTISPECIES: hypothetical protein [unclassified Rhizobium]MDF0661720.1 hypothetical protein [Rhizobium sp. BC49]PDS87488.1 hypothetical protein CO654_03285 [Rhizobium sp. L18]
MIVSLSRDLTVKLLLPDDFKALSLRLDESWSTGLSDGDFSSGLAGWGSLEDPNHVWVRTERLRKLGPQAADWLARFDAMIDKAAQYGWTRDHGAEVRMHIDRSKIS